MAEDQFDFFSLFQRNKIKESFYETSFPGKKEENGGTFFEKFEENHSENNISFPNELLFDTKEPVIPTTTNTDKESTKVSTNNNYCMLFKASLVDKKKEQKMSKLLRNRISARKSRLKKKEKLEKLKTQITTSQKEIKNLKREISRLKNKKDSGNSYQKLLSDVSIHIINYIIYS